MAGSFLIYAEREQKVAMETNCSLCPRPYDIAKKNAHVFLDIFSSKDRKQLSHSCPRSSGVLAMPLEPSLKGK